MAAGRHVALLCDHSCAVHMAVVVVLIVGSFFTAYGSMSVNTVKQLDTFKMEGYYGCAYVDYAAQDWDLQITSEAICFGQCLAFSGKLAS